MRQREKTFSFIFTGKREKNKKKHSPSLLHTLCTAEKEEAI